MERERRCQNSVRERQLCSGDASALSPGVPRHISNDIKKFTMYIHTHTKVKKNHSFFCLVLYVISYIEAFLMKFELLYILDYVVCIIKTFLR